MFSKITAPSMAFFLYSCCYFCTLILLILPLNLDPSVVVLALWSCWSWHVSKFLSDPLTLFTFLSRSTFNTVISSKLHRLYSIIIDMSSRFLLEFCLMKLLTGKGKRSSALQLQVCWMKKWFSYNWCGSVKTWAISGLDITQIIYRQEEFHLGLKTLND